MPNQLQMAGSQSKRQSRFVPIFTNRFFSGLWTQRNPLRDAATTRIVEKFYGGNGDSLIDGLNVELTTKLTLQRRPGCSVYNYQIFPAINSFYEFRQYQPTGSTINIIADTANFIYDCTGPYNITEIFPKSAHSGPAYFQSVGNYLYFGDGLDQEKYFYNSTGTSPGYLTQLWGIASATQAPGTIIPTGSPQLPTILSTATAAIDYPFSGVVPDIPAIPPQNFVTPTLPMDSTFSAPCFTGDYYTGTTGPIGSNYVTYICGSPFNVTVQGTTFDYSIGIPVGATITNVQVTFARSAGVTGGVNFNVTTGNVSLIDSSSNTVYATVAPASDVWSNPAIETVNFPSPSITVAQINAMTFGMQVSFSVSRSNGGYPFNCYIGHYNMIVSYTIPGIPAIPYTVNSWQNPSDAIPPQPSETYIVTGPNTVYDQLVCGSFLVSALPLTIPLTNVVNGISIFFNYHVDVYNSDGLPTPLTFTLYSNGIPLGSKTFSVSTVPLTATGFNLGGAADLWGNDTITPTQINAGLQIGVSVQVGSNVAYTQYIGQPSISLYTSYPSTVTVGSGGTLAGAIGYEYVYCYGNSITNHVSTASPATNSTGPVANAIINISVVASSDPQVNQIRVFRTVDGGSTFFELPTSPYLNVTQTIQDQAPNTGTGGLQLDSIAPIADNNDPPPVGIINLIYNNGSIWGSVNNTVVYSRWPDGTLGVPVESFPPDNYFIFPSAVTALVPTSQGIAVFTTSDLYIIVGSPSQGYEAGLSLTRLGLLSAKALSVNGTIIYMMSSDSQFLSLDPSSGVSELGMPIGDLLDGTNTIATVRPVYSPITTYVTWHVQGSSDKAIYVANGSTGWFRLSPTASPETGFTWSPFAQIVNGCQAVQSVEVSPGQYRLLIGPSVSGPILQRDQTVYADNNFAYPAFATFGNIVLAQPGQMAELSSIVVDAVATGSTPSISVILDEISGTFQPLLNYVNDPPALFPSTSLYSNRYYFSQNPSITAWCRHMQIKVSWPIEAYKNEIYTMTIIGAHWAEV